jgi:hypothetical protein
MVSEEQHVQVELKKVLVAMETKRTDFDNIRQDVNKVKKHISEISDENFLFCLSISEILFVISDFIFSNAASMSLRSLYICTIIFGKMLIR